MAEPARATTASTTARVMAVGMLSSPAAIGRNRFVGCCRSSATSCASLIRYPAEATPQNAAKVTVASATASNSLNFAEKSRPAKTRVFLTHSWGRIALRAARKGPRRGFTGAPSGAACATSGSLRSWRASAMKREG